MKDRAIIYFSQLARAILLGQMVFFAAVLAPRVFTVLDRQNASNLQNAIFGPYFTIGLICSMVMLVCELLKPKSKARSILANKRLRLVLIASLCIVFAYLKFNLFVEMQQLNPVVLLHPKGATEVTEVARFQELHYLSRNLNVFALLSLLIL